MSPRHTVTPLSPYHRLPVGVVRGGSRSFLLLHAGGVCVPASAVPQTTQTRLRPGSTEQHLLDAFPTHCVPFIGRSQAVLYKRVSHCNNRKNAYRLFV